MIFELLGLARKVVSDAVMRLEALGLLEIVDPGLGSRPRVVRALEPTTQGSSSASRRQPTRMQSGIETFS